MTARPDRDRQPIFTAEVDELVEFNEVAQNNPQAPVKQRIPSEQTHPIFSVGVDVVHEFHEVACPVGISTNGLPSSKADTSAEPKPEPLGEQP